MIGRLVLAAALAAVAALPLRAQVSVQEITSPGGIDAWLVEERAIPFLALELRFLGGTNLDPVGREGATALMAGLLSEGAGDLDSRAFATELEALAASFSVSTGGDTLSVSATFLTENRDAVVALMRSALSEPRFDSDAVERLRARAISGARSDLRNPNGIASRRFSELAFGDHPYARRGDGTEESLVALTVEDLRAAHGAALARDRLHVAAVGDIGAEELGELLDVLLGWLPETGAALPPHATVALDGGVTVVPFDGPQSLIAFGHAGIARDDPDFLAAFVLLESFGSGRFGTRLMRELRERRGLTYGVGAFVSSRSFGETIEGRFSTDNARAAEAIEILRVEWARMATEGPTEEEVAAVRTYLTGSYPLRFDGNANIARILVGMQIQGLPADYMTYRNDLVAALGRDELAAVAARLLDAEALHFVVVGRPDGIAAD